MKRILVVEDNEDTLNNIKYILSNSGYYVVTAENGTKSIALAKELAPDLILMDVMLPDIEGGDAVSIIKKHAPCKNVPVIFLTGLISSAEERHGLKSIIIGGTKYPALAKPYDLAQLLEAIRSLLNKTE